MGLREQFQDLAQTARAAFDNIFETCAYWPAPDQPDYDANSGTPIWHTAPPLAASVEAAFVGYNLHEQAASAGAVQPRDEKCLIAALDCPVVPKPGDMLLRSASRTPEPRAREVIAVRDAGGAAALYVMQVRPYHGDWPEE